MALHRDIFWIGRQWAVTGFGMQAVNQKHDGRFDIPVERLWDDNLLEAVHEQKWFNPDDFAKGLAIAQARHPKPPRRPGKPATPLPVDTLPQVNATVAVPEPDSLVIPTVEAPTIVLTETAAEPAKPSNPPHPPPSFFPIRLLGHPARLVRVWRVRQQL